MSTGFRTVLKLTGPLIAAFAASVLIASSASATAPADGAGTKRALSLQTLFDGVRVFSSPTTASAVNVTLGRWGTGVDVVCWTTGSMFRDTRIWYRISAPAVGYVPAFNFAAHFAPAVGLSHCATPAFSEKFNALGAGLRIRAAPSTAAAVIASLAGVGSTVTVDCYAKGTPIFGDVFWYYVSTPAAGYVTGRFLNTGGDPVPGVPAC
jgi:hypothetical protein